MTITETRFQRRADTSVPFFSEDTNLPIFTTWQNSIQPYITAGKASATNITSDDGLTHTRTFTYDSLETFGEIDTLRSIEVNNEYLNYTKSNSLIELDYTQLENRRNTYQLSGIDQAFKVTTTYTFPAQDPATYGSTSIMLVFANALEHFADGLSKKIDTILDETTITVVHQYNNASDFTDYCYNDLFFVPQLHEAGATRTIKYELV